MYIGCPILNLASFARLGWGFSPPSPVHSAPNGPAALGKPRRRRSSRNAVLRLSELVCRTEALTCGNDFDLFFFLLIICFVVLCKAHWAIDVFRANDPGDLFHVLLAGHTLVVVVGAPAHLERHQASRTQESAQHNLFALCEPVLNVRPVAGLAKRLASFGCSRPDP